MSEENNFLSNSNLDTEDSAKEIRSKIIQLVKKYAEISHKKKDFTPGNSFVPTSGRVYDFDEIQMLTSASLDFWLTTGRFNHQFEKRLSEFVGINYVTTTNSGSSANLLALSALTSDKLGNRSLKAGDEVICVAASFPTTINPIIQNNLIPVFVDIEFPTYNIDPKQIEDAISEKTKAIMLAHTLGNPFDLRKIMEISKEHNLWVVEDCCDALGSKYDGKMVGTFGDVSTLSFYPAHHITMGEGGAVNISGSLKLKRPAESFRDWGRDCYCPSGKDNTCKKRFSWQLGELPEGYDHKFIYSHLGYNFKPLDIQAAIGRVQLKRLPAFIEARKQNWEYLRNGLSGLEDYFEFALPEHATSWIKNGFTWDDSGCRTDCSWFGFMLKVKAEAPFTKSELAQNLDQNKIGNRMLFGGNLLRQPAFIQLKKDRPESYRVVGNLNGADQLMQQALFLGTYPGLNKEMLDYEIEVIHNFTKSCRS